MTKQGRVKRRRTHFRLKVMCWTTKSEIGRWDEAATGDVDHVLDVAEELTQRRIPWRILLLDAEPYICPPPLAEIRKESPS